MKLKKIASLALAACLGIVLAACGATAVVPDTCTVEVGETVKLNITVDTDATAEELAETWKNADITWESADPRIARVDEGGNVTGVRAGETDITVRANAYNLDATCRVTVVKPESEPKAEPEQQVLKLALDADGTDGIKALEKTGVSLPDQVDEDTLTWRSSNEKIAALDEKGVVTPVGVGSCVITVTGRMDEEEWTASFRLEVCDTVDEDEKNAAPLVQKSTESAGRTENPSSGKSAPASAQKSGSTGTAGKSGSTASATGGAAPAGSSGAQSGGSSAQLCPICEHPLVNGKCQYIHTYSGYGYCTYDEATGTVYVVCNSCGQSWPRDSFADVWSFTKQHAISCYAEHHKVYITCEQCGAAFEEGTEPEIMRTTGYCSTACQLASGYYCPVCLSALYIDGCHNCGYGMPQSAPDASSEQPASSDAQSVPQPESSSAPADSSAAAPAA